MSTRTRLTARCNCTMTFVPRYRLDYNVPCSGRLSHIIGPTRRLSSLLRLSSKGIRQLTNFECGRPTPSRQPALTQPACLTGADRRCADLSQPTWRVCSQSRTTRPMIARAFWWHCARLRVDTSALPIHGEFTSFCNQLHEAM